MEIVCVSSSSKNKGKGTSDANPPAPLDPKRQKDWTVHETNVLIDVVHQYQCAHGVSGLSFSNIVWSLLHKQFKAIIPNTICDKGKLKNRMKVMREKFVICYDLVDNKSDGHWNYVKQRPGAPSDAEYVEMVKAKGPKANFLLPSRTDPTKGTFPWYEQMRTMIGGQTSRGNATKPSWDCEVENSQHLPGSQWSARPSEQGSSDDGGDFPNNTEVSSPPRRSFSQRSHPVSQSSGSKRKSTDESVAESNSRRKNKGKSYRERHQNGKEELQKLAIAGLEISNSIKAESTQEREQIEECIIKMNDFGYSSGPEFDYILHEIECLSRRVWFLKATKEMVTTWLAGTKLFGNQAQAKNNPYGFTAMLSRGQVMPAYPNPRPHGGYNYVYPPPEF